jgi:hypothetical protein
MDYGHGPRRPRTSPTTAWGLCHSPLDQCSRTASITLRPRLWDFVARASTALRPRLGDFVACASTSAWGLPRSLSDHDLGTSSLASRLLSDHGLGISSLAPRPVLGDCLNHSPTTARGLYVSTTCDWQLAYSWDIFSHLELATRLIPRLPASSGTTSVRCTCRCISYRLYDDWIFNLIGNSF